MAIDKGIAILSTDLQQVGGIKHILLRSWAADDTISYDSTDNHLITSIVDTGGSTADWYLYEFKAQEANMTINATKENGSTAFECGLSFMLPKMGDAKFTEVQNMLTDCMMGIAVDNNGTAFVLGVSEKYQNTKVVERSQTFLSVASIEGGTGSAYTDQNGITVNLTCKQFELPREYSGTINYYTDATPSASYKATTS
tara:strand:+ start:1332 stop:1925 length:594 start_codon:yes stop_codon:yes gene_type:complete